MCNICDDIHETIRIEHKYHYFNIVYQIKVMIDEGILLLIEGNCDFDQVSRNKSFSDDVLYHVFKCTNCECKFSLCLETYHESGGSWELISKSTNEHKKFDAKVFEENWLNFFNVCKEEFNNFSDTLKCLLDGVDLPLDVKIVLIAQLGEHAKKWIQNKVPVLKYCKPIELAKTDSGLSEIKAILMSMPS
jgi:hypothetical protein